MGITRRRFIQTLAGALGAAALAPVLLRTRGAHAAPTAAFGRVKHVLYVRLRGGFRFTATFNGDVAEEFNPFGLSSGRASGAEWGVSKLFEAAPYLEGPAGSDGARRRALGVQAVPAIANQIAVLPCVDHEPTAASADGNHGTGLERYWTGSVGGPAGLLTLVNYGLRAKFQAATAEGKILLPAFVLGDGGMARGLGIYAAHRPPVLQNGGLDAFGLGSEDRLPSWARSLSEARDARFRDRLPGESHALVDAFVETRKATTKFAEIFRSPELSVSPSDTPVDGLSNNDLRLVLGDSDAGRAILQALRLFHVGAPAAYVDQGSYDMHSGEESQLPGALAELGQLIAGTLFALQRLQHPDGGTYWDHTVVAFGSEFGRTTNGSRFNSARGSDHGGDYATRWMSMPFFGGPVAAPGKLLGATARRADLAPDGEVVGYRSVMKTLLEGLGCDHSDVFPADPVFAPLLGA